MSRVINAVVTEEDGMFVAMNPDTGVASQGSTVDSALGNLREAVLLYLEEVGDEEIDTSATKHTLLTTITV